MKRLFSILAFALAIGLSFPLGVGAAGSVASTGGGGTSDAPSVANAPSVDTTSAIVQLKGDPLATYVSTKPAKGKKIDFNSATVKSYRAQLSALRNDFKAWLRANAPKAKVTSEFDTSLNAVSVDLNGESLATISGAPQVLNAQYEGLYHLLGVDPDLSIIKAQEAWAVAGGEAKAGQGVKVAIVDTGIDKNHPCFSDAGYPSQKQLGDTRFTNNKVIAAKVFNNRTVSFGYTPAPIQEHGTHVAGTVACDFQTPAVVNGVSIPYGVSGVAPRALLGNYNVFPGDVTNARSEDIMNALEAAYDDGFDVANMSLGGGYHGVQDLLMVVVDNLDQANMVVAVAAGNSGPGLNTVESPGAAARALAAGASTVPHFVGAPVTVNGATYGAATGEFAILKSDLIAPLGVVTGSVNGLGTACAALPSGSLSGKIALLTRGTCSFSTKIRNAQNAGAALVLVANNVVGDPVAMAQDGTPNQPTVPAYMVGLATGQALKTLDGASTTVGANLQYFLTTNVDIMAGFSSQGPTNVDFRVKPDVVAPGVNVLSSIPLAFCGAGATTCWAFLQGTSMATPHLAGSAAVVRGIHPDWSAAQVRSAIVNTADSGVLRSYNTGAPVNNVNVIGAGRENLLQAVNAKVSLDPVSVSFGAVPTGSGQTQQFNVTLTNVSGVAQTYQVGVGAGDSSVAFSVSSSSITLPPNGSAVVTVVMTAIKDAVPGGHQATLTVSVGGNEVAHAAVYTLVK